MKNPIRFMSRKLSKASSKLDLEGGSVYFGVPVFSFAELEDVTNKFDASKELGDGGFGTVYYGKHTYNLTLFILLEISFQ